MPVSHLGLTVSHIPSATSFYLSALQPLGYRYIGQDGSTIGLGVHTADLFLTQEPRGARVTPSHVAFCADSRLTVRDCYTSALHAGGHPSGAPAYCNEDRTVFNAAVEDLDGNTVEFIFREPDAADYERPGSVHGSEDEAAHVSTWRKRVARSAARDDVRSYRTSSRDHHALDLGAPRYHTETGSRAHTARTSVQHGVPSTAVIGTILGAAAGAAVVYAVRKSERGSAEDEVAFSASARQRARRHSDAAPPAEPPRSELRRSSTRAKSSHRNYSVTETTYEPQRGRRATRAIEAGGLQEDHVTATVGRYRASQRQSTSGRTSYRSAEGDLALVSDSERKSRLVAQPSPPVPSIPRQYYLEAAPIEASVASSHRRVPRSSLPESSDDKRRDSGISVHSSRHSRPSRHSSSSTVKPVRRASSPHNSAADIPLPASRSASYVSAAQYPLPRSHSGRSRVDESDDSDGLSDTGTVVPDDSISCIDLSRPRRRRSKKSHGHSSRHTDAQSEVVVRAVASPRHRSKGSHHSAAVSLPIRSRDSHSDRRDRPSGRRSVATHA